VKWCWLAGWGVKINRKLKESKHVLSKNVSTAKQRRVKESFENEIDDSRGWLAGGGEMRKLKSRYIKSCWQGSDTRLNDRQKMERTIEKYKKKNHKK
jgi:hypothetical protein